jgi:hypothetical protein
MTRPFPFPVLVISGLALALSLGLGGCASGGMLDQLPPALGGEPDSLPKRPETGYQFPAVHDMPPARAIAPMSDSEQVRLEKELQTARDRQNALYSDDAEKPAAAAPAPKKKPTPAKNGQTSGAKTNP